MTGNVREWCADPYRPYSELIDLAAATKPAASCADPNMGYVVRGGSFQSDDQDAMSFNRDGVKGDEEPIDLGFRVVIDCPSLTAPH